MAPIRFAILTVSDTCYAGQNQDKSGPKLEECIKIAFPDSLIVAKEIVPDEKDIISGTLTKWSLYQDCDVILTTGGTGFASRDVTPEATRAVIDKEAPGLVITMISKSLAVTKMAMLSRAVCGIKNKSIILNLPGSVKGVAECFGFIEGVLSHAVALLRDDKETIKCDHRKVQSGGAVAASKVKLSQVAFRNRSSPYPMVEVAEAQKLIFEKVPRGVSTEVIDMCKSLNRILAEDIYASDPLPPFNASIKDGYAVRVADGAGVRRVRDVVAAGDDPSKEPLAPGEIVRISTGAAVPEGADAVVQVEDTALVEATPDGSKELLVKIEVAPKLLQDIRKIGSDIEANSCVLCKGDLITAGHIGVLATVGKTKVQVYRQAKVAVISTGNEVQNPDEELKPGHIRDCNKSTLLNLLKQYSFEGSDCGLAKDNPDSVKKALVEAFQRHDVVVTTGGVSMGEFDVIKKVLEEDFGAQIHFGRVNMKPGKPTTFATCQFQDKQKFVFGLPGNPVSATVTSLLFLIPALRHYQNNKIATLTSIPVTLGTPMPLDLRPEYVRVNVCNNLNLGILRAYPVGNQISSRINSFVNANALLLLPQRSASKDVCSAGEKLEVFLMEPFSVGFEEN